MSILTGGSTTTIDSSESATAVVAAMLAGNILITTDSGTPVGDPVVVDLTGLASIAALSSITVQGGATAIIGAGLIGVTAATTLTINGGIIEIQPGAVALGALSTINVGPNGGELKLDAPGLGVGLLAVPVHFTNGVPANFKLDFPGSTSIPATYDPSSNTTTIGDGVSVLGVVTIGRVTTLSGNVFNIAPDGNGNYVMNFTATGGYSDGSGGVITCFLPGTGIETPSGEVAVETIRVGDEVAVVVDGARTARQVVWVGSQHIEMSAVATPADHCPVRIRRDAIASGVPSRDLLVTPEHCLLFGGKLIPARMLVNGRSIVAEHGIASFDIHHVETAEHSILLANGAMSESYLDTGNRARFSSPAAAGVIVRFPAAAKTWEHDAAAPLAVDSATVEPIWLELTRRAKTLGLEPHSAALAMTLERVTDPDLHLQTDAGMEIRPVLCDGNVYAFVVPAGTRRIRLLSRASRPSDTIGPFLDDRRHLGVQVGAIGVSDGARRGIVDSHLAGAALDGWHAIDDGAPRRWTDGNAVLPLDLNRHAGRTIYLDIEVMSLGAYLVTGSTSDDEHADPMVVAA